MGLIFILVAFAYIVFAGTIVMKTRGWWNKAFATIVIALIPTFDFLVAQAYMYIRCAEDGGLRVHQVVTLRRTDLVVVKPRPRLKQELWSREITSLVPGAAPEITFKKSGQVQDNPKFVHYLLPDRYEPMEKRENMGFGIEKVYRAYHDRSNNKLLGEMTAYGHASSWVISMFGFGGRGWGCPAEFLPSDLNRAIFRITQ